MCQSKVGAVYAAYVRSYFLRCSVGVSLKCMRVVVGDAGNIELCVFIVTLSC